MARGKENSDARQRLIETADRLFYREGLRAVGIDRIIAEAGVAKATLYAHFPSKDDLILAVLQWRELKTDEFFASAMGRHVKAGKGRLAAFYAALREFMAGPDFRGCCFINAATELADPSHPAAKFVPGQKRRFHAFLAGLVEEAVGRPSPAVAEAAAVLTDGAIVTGVIRGCPDPADTAREAVLRLVAAERA
jgi:AcrR family transcriptional regulator